MKTLLVCTDFSDPAFHAARYACMLASQYKLPYVTLFHAWHSMVTTTALPFNPDEEQEQARAVMHQLKELKSELEMTTGKDTMIMIRAEKLSLGENINLLCEEENADMIVMGVAGKSRLEKTLIGSDTANVSRNSKFPVCIVPLAAPLQPVTHILFAYDFDDARNTTPYARLEETLSFFNASLTVLNVGHKNRHFSPQAPGEMYQLHHMLEKFNPQYDVIENKDITTGILNYAKDHNISMILTVPKNYNFLQQILHKRTTEDLIYHSSIPLLSLHE